jgi:GH15 family glucan-1,4-alpha-glucosidase
LPNLIEDYALIGDCHTAALVSRQGSIDWLCMPHFDSPACFAALVGGPENGYWSICPVAPIRKTQRRYRPGTLIVETEFETAEGSIVLIDFMTPRDGKPDLVRLVAGRSGKVSVRMELALRFDYGSVVPWVESTATGISAIAGPDMVSLRTPAALHGEEFTTVAEFDVAAGEEVPFDLTWYPSNRYEPSTLDARAALLETDEWWQSWSSRCTYEGKWREAVLRSLITLKALTFEPTGGIVAAPTTSLPEKLGGVRNWDYRYCWVRDASLTLDSLLNAGYVDEARSWREWLLRAVAGNPGELNIAYGLRGERRLTELELPWLAGYENSRPVRIGNAAYHQFQLDIYGEIAATLFQCRKAGMEAIGSRKGVVQALLRFLETAWERPDEGIWEVRGPRRHFTHSKMMAWVALDRAVHSIENGWLPDNPNWAVLRDRIHAQVCERGFDPELNSFVQFYGSKYLDSSLLMMPLVGFLPASDPRVKGTVEAIEKHLMSSDGFVNRYTTDPKIDGLPEGEAAFLPCTFWLADNYVLQGREQEGEELFERLLSVRNDVGLLAEEFDPVSKRLLGNFPQAFCHVGLVNTAFGLSRRENRPVAGPMSVKPGTNSSAF